MSRAVKIFGDAALGSLFFEGVPIPPAPLGGVVRAVALDGSTNRIRVFRDDQFQKNGVDPRILFKRMRITRVRNKADQRLVQDLGYTQQQVIDYINDEANRKANENDFQKDGVQVGSANTVNFTGAGVSSVSVSGDVATVTIVNSGNPVSSGSVTGAGNTTLRLTLDDSTNVDIDVTSLRTTTAIGSSTAYFFLNNGAQLANNQHDKNGGVVFYGTRIRRGEELVFTVPGEDLHVGVWNGGNGVTGVGNVNNKSNWSTKWYFDNSESDWKSSTGTYRKTGVELNRDVNTNGGTYSIRYGYDSEKLELHEHSTAFSWLISSANTGVGTTQTYIYFSSEDQSQASTPGSLPTVSQVRASEWTLQSYRNTQAGPTIHTGVQDDDIWKSTRSLRPGMKLKATLNSATKIHHWGVGYGGTTGMGNGPENPYQNATGSWRSSNSTELRAEQNSTFNTNYTAISSGSDPSTSLDLSGRNISWRYNSDNSWDLFDEDTDEVILTGDTNLDGGDMYPYLFGASTINTYDTEIPQWEWDWNQAEWFLEHRDWESGYAQTSALDLRATALPMKTAAAGLLDSGGGFMHMSNSRFNITWGEKMRPGQELSWTQLSINQNGATKNNMIVGVLNSSFNGYTHGFRFYRNGDLKPQIGLDAGVTVQAGISTTATAGHSCRLKYDYSDNKLKLEVVRSGVRETLAVSDSALDGNPIFISMGGDSTRMPSSTQGVQVYGWEIAHEPPGYYNPWNNWRIGGFPENTNLSVGIASTGNVLAWAADQVWRHKDGLAAGYKMHWLTPATHPNGQIGQWSSSNASSGLSNLENVDTYWDWSWQHNTSEEIDAVKGWTFNTSNSNYSATKWTDPNPGTTRISLRYHSDNSMDLFDETNSEIIISKSVANDGNPIYLSWVVGGATNNQNQMQDDFFNGGDVGIALTTTAVS